MTDDLSKSLRELRNSTEELNTLTDQANDLVRCTEHFLSKECRVGGPVVTLIPWMSGDAEGPNGEPGPEYCTYLSYKRHNGEHRILVEHTLDHELRVSKPWAESSRDEKLDTIKALPMLIGELSQKVDKQVSEVRATVTALEGLLPSEDASKKPTSRRRRG